MKNFIAALVCLFPFIVTACPSGLSGTYTIGPAGNYPTISAALSALRTNGVTNHVVLELKANYTYTGETFPLAFNGISCLSATKTLTLRPAAGASNLQILFHSPDGTQPVIDLSDAR